MDQNNALAEANAIQLGADKRAGIAGADTIQMSDFNAGGEASGSEMPIERLGQVESPTRPPPILRGGAEKDEESFDEVLLSVSWLGGAGGDGAAVLNNKKDCYKGEKKSKWQNGVIPFWMKISLEPLELDRKSRLLKKSNKRARADLERGRLDHCVVFRGEVQSLENNRRG